MDYRKVAGIMRRLAMVEQALSGELGKREEAKSNRCILFPETTLWQIVDAVHNCNNDLLAMLPSDDSIAEIAGE
jgi:hypothetical protein